MRVEEYGASAAIVSLQTEGDIRPSPAICYRGDIRCSLYRYTEEGTPVAWRPPPVIGADRSFGTVRASRRWAEPLSVESLLVRPDDAPAFQSWAIECGGRIGLWVRA